jgi:hypothetical protein
MFRSYQLYNNQFFDYLSEQLPRNIKDMFKWCELVYYNTPLIVNGIRKLVNYPITDLIYDTQLDTVKTHTKNFLESTLDIKTHLISTGLDYYIYGNSFKSIYFPFDRFLICSKCKNKINIRNASYRMKKVKFILKCPVCKAETPADIEDITNSDLSRIKITTWNVYDIDVVENKITGEKRYFYTIPRDIRNGIFIGDPTILNTIPSIFIDAVRENKKVEFGSNIFHLRTPSLSGFNSPWGVSSLVATLKLYLYIAVLRKSTEAIGMEHIVPQRILYPEARTQDPTIGSSMAKWKEQISSAIKLWRRDPNYVMLAPYPTGVVNIGSQGRALMPTAEIKQAEEDMLRSLDIPPEFIMGTTNINNSQVALRMLENQLTPYMSQITNYVNWIVNSVNNKYNGKLCNVSFTNIKFADDIAKLNFMTQLSTSGAVAKSTIQESLGINPIAEREKIIKETVDSKMDEKVIANKINKMELDMSEQAMSEEASNDSDVIPQYNQQKLIAKAQQLAMQFISMPLEQRQSYMAKLQNEDYVMWSLVRAQIENMKQSSTGPT